MKALRRIALLAAVLTAVTLSTVAQAQIRQDVPQDCQPPIYAVFLVSDSCPIRRTGRS